MVEFAFAFIFVIATLFGALQLILIGYNYNIAERTVWEAARAVSVGRRDAETGMMPNDTGVYGIVQRQFLDKVFTGGLMTVDFNRDLNDSPLISPDTEIERGEGQTTIVDLTYKTGFFIPGLGKIITLTFPVKARIPIVAYNDVDRDGCVDSLEGTINVPFVDTGPACRSYAHTYRNDHDNDGVADASYPEGPVFYTTGQADDDGDGISNVNDSGYVRICGNPDAGGTVYYFHPVLTATLAAQGHTGHATVTTYTHTDTRSTYAAVYGAPTYTDTGGPATLCVDMAPNTNGPFNDGQFASHLFWVTSTGNIVEDDWHWLHRDLPWGQRGNTVGDCVTLFLDLHYDRDNDAWEDRFDAYPDDYTRH